MTTWLGQLLELEGAQAIERAEITLSAPWAQRPFAAGWLLLALVLVAALSVVFYVRGQCRGRLVPRLGLAASRALALGLLVWMLAEPVLLFHLTSNTRPQLWLLLDGSDSMAIEDELSDAQRSTLAEAVGLPAQTPADGSSPRENRRSRADYVRALFNKKDANLLAQLQHKFRLKLFVFDDALRELPEPSAWLNRPDQLAAHWTPRGAYTAIGGALEELSRRQSAGRVAGVVIFSDFNQNSGPAAEVAAARLGVPVYTVGVGPQAAMDINVKIDAPLWMTRNELSEITVVVEHDGIAHDDLDQPAVEVKVTARRIDETTGGLGEPLLVGQRRISLGNAAAQAVFPFTPEQTGQFVFAAEVPRLEREVVDQNNRAEREASIRDDFLRLMFVEHEPTWEWRFIKEVFHRDKLVGMRGFRTFLRSADPQVRQENELFLTTMTPSRSEFFTHDVIFLGDLPAATLSTRFCELAKEFVGRFGGGMVVLAGPRFGPGQLAGTPLADMLPVVVDPDLRTRDDRQFELQFTPEAAAYSFIRLGTTPEENNLAWKNLGQLSWYQPVARAIDRATVLAVHPLDRTPSGQPQPLIAVRQYGEGIVVYFGFNETWRLRRRYGEQYYRQLWGQLIHQLASRRALGTHKRFTVRTDRPQYRVDEAALVSVEAYDADYQPLPDDRLAEGKLAAEVIVPARTVQGEMRVEPIVVTRKREALFEGKIPLDVGGEYRVRVKDPITGQYAEARFRVLDVSAERRSAVRNVALQTEIALATGGKSFDLAEAGRLVEEINLPRRIETSIEIVPLWSTWPCFLLLLALLVSEWFFRKLITLP
jgi:hypothetical protein